MRLVLPAVFALLFLPSQARCDVSDSRFLGIQAARAMRLAGLSVPLDANSEADGGSVFLIVLLWNPKKSVAFVLVSYPSWR